MLGGGTFISQNKKLPGTYINFASAKSASSSMAERGYAGMAIEMDWGKDGEIIEVTAENFQKNALELFGYDYASAKLVGLRELFRNVTTAYLYKLNSGAKAKVTLPAGEEETGVQVTAKYSGIRGNDIKIVVARNVDDTTKFDVSTYIDGKEVDIQIVSTSADLMDNDFVTFAKTGILTATAGTSLTGGTNGTATGDAHQAFLNKLESYQVNAIGCLSNEDSIKNLYVEYAKRLRDKQGIKFQVVVFNSAADYEGVVNLTTTTAESTLGLIYWVTGIIAGCPINKSNTNKTYDGELTVNADYTQTQLEDSIDAGQLVLHKVGNEIRVLVDINSLINTTDDKGEVFKSNQTIRILDQIATDVASIFNSKYIGKIPNNEAGRTSLWNDVVTLFKEYQTLQAIEDFEDADVTIEIGNDKKSVAITSSVQVINAMEKLYMTVIVG